MTIMEMFGQSGVLTLLGMAVVFGFLLIMIIFVTITGKVILSLGFNKEALEPSLSAAGAVGTGTPPGVIAAIGAAVNEYQKTENRG